MNEMRVTERQLSVGVMQYLLSPTEVVLSAQGEALLRFSLPESWQGLEVRALFIPEVGAQRHSLLDHAGACPLPPGLCGGYGTLHLDGADSARSLHTTAARYQLLSDRHDARPAQEEPDASLWDQFAAQTSRLRGELADACSEALAAAGQSAASAAASAAALDELRRGIGTGQFKGDDGFSPAARVERLTDGARITITDKSGTTTAEVHDGKGGGSGAVSSVNGKTGAVVLSAADVGAMPDDTPIPPAYDDTQVRESISSLQTTMTKRLSTEIRHWPTWSETERSDARAKLGIPDFNVYYVGTEEPTSAVGNDGDLYLKV